VSGDGSTNALMVQLPMGPIRLMQRLQWGRTDYRHRAVPFGFDRRQSQSSASYTPGRWGSVNYQQSIQFFDDGTVQEWDEVSSMLQLGDRTRAQLATAFPHVSDLRRFRARVTQRLSPTLELEGQFGRLSAFQLDRASEGEQSRILVTIRKTWQITSAARGGDVRGRAIDHAGYPVQGALVRLGPYSAITDGAGDYTFRRVPDGQFDLSLDKDKLPAAYALDEKPRPLTVTRGTRERIDLPVIPLNAIRGRVYLDRNQNGYWDEGEGIPNAVVGISGSVTATTATGSYAFYNQPPGRYLIRLDVKRLAKGIVAASAAELEVELTTDSPLIGIDFIVEKKDMPILMRAIPR
jgi:protocatechuate 3,4-dioxygenase beta subunit